MHCAAKQKIKKPLMKKPNPNLNIIYYVLQIIKLHQPNLKMLDVVNQKIKNQMIFTFRLISMVRTFFIELPKIFRFQFTMKLKNFMNKSIQICSSNQIGQISLKKTTE